MPMSDRIHRREFLKHALAGVALAGGSDQAAAAERKGRLPKIRGPLRPHPANGRYFTDDSGRAIWLAGPHLGWELQDDAWDKQCTFDFTGYLDLLTRHGHNLVRLWNVEHTRTDDPTASTFAFPMPFVRTGPGNAQDGRPKFDLNRFDEGYFRRLRERTVAAGGRGIVVAVMLFQGWSHRVSRKYPHDPWFGNVYNAANNINSIDGARGGPARNVHTLGDSRLLEILEAYVRKVADTVGDLDNLLYEISNESLGSLAWHEQMVRVIRDHEARKGRTHPIFLSGCGDGLTNAELLGSSAEAVGLSGIGKRAYLNNPPAADGRKIVIHDTDHIKPDHRSPAFVWKNFMRGNHVLVLDWDLVDRKDKEWEPIRRAMGSARALSEEIDLAMLTPVPELASSGFCLAGERKILAYQPGGGPVELDLRGFRGPCRVVQRALPGGPPRQSGVVSGGRRVKVETPGGRDALVETTRAG